jgi:hypothetical protein
MRILRRWVRSGGMLRMLRMESIPMKQTIAILALMALT